MKEWLEIYIILQICVHYALIGVAIMSKFMD